MKHSRLLIAPLVALTSGLLVSQTFNFDKDPGGKTPTGFSTALTGKGKPGTWIVIEDETAPSKPNVLAQTDMDKTDYRFPICVFDSVTAKDVDVTVKFKSVKGSVDQAGGIVWRYLDENNYYILRANALEDNLRMYRVVNGRRQELKGANVKVTSGKWHTLNVRNVGRNFEASLDGKKLIETTDETFGNAGKVGLWTKADSYTLFDDLVIQRIEEKKK